jgi:hypothetical protein
MNYNYRTNLTAERLREVLSYDPLTGEFRWKIKTGRVCIGQISGSVSNQGYKNIRIDGTAYRASRLAFLYMIGRFPDFEVDHADSDPSNDTWANVREATRSQNIANTKRRSDNTSGFKSVCWSRALRKWYARIHVNNKEIWLGAFVTPAEAHAAYLAAAIKHFGEFACDGREVVG